MKPAGDEKPPRFSWARMQCSETHTKHSRRHTDERHTFGLACNAHKTSVCRGSLCPMSVLVQFVRSMYVRGCPGDISQVTYRCVRTPHMTVLLVRVERRTSNRLSEVAEVAGLADLPYRSSSGTVFYFHPSMYSYNSECYATSATRVLAICYSYDEYRCSLTRSSLHITAYPKSLSFKVQ